MKVSLQLWKWNAAWLAFAAAVFISVADRADADLVGISNSQRIATSVSSGGPDPPPDNDDFINASFPPVSASISSVSGVVVASGSQTISSYIGPMSAGDVTPTLTLIGGTSASSSSTPLITIALASSSIEYDFTLTAFHPYTWAFTSSSTDAGFGTAALSFGPMGLPVSQGSGILSPGSYELASLSAAGTFLPFPGQPGTNTVSYSLEIGPAIAAIPEPAAWVFGAIVLAGCGSFPLVKRVAGRLLGKS